MSDIRIQLANEGERHLPIFSELAQRMDAVRQRAFEMFAERGGTEGRDLDDWIAAEHEVLGWPAAELKEANGAFQVDVTLPGFAAKDVEVTATPTELIVHAASTQERKGEDEYIVWSEFGSNDVYRRFGFPKSVDVDKVTAKLENGILKVMAPKAEALAPQGSARAEITPEMKPELKADLKADMKADVKAEPKPEMKSEKLKGLGEIAVAG